MGCKDGTSLSVAVVEHLAAQLSLRGLSAVSVRHRELDRERRGKVVFARAGSKSHVCQAESKGKASAPDSSDACNSPPAELDGKLDGASGSPHFNALPVQDRGDSPELSCE